MCIYSTNVYEGVRTVSLTLIWVFIFSPLTNTTKFKSNPQINHSKNYFSHHQERLLFPGGVIIVL